MLTERRRDGLGVKAAVPELIENDIASIREITAEQPIAVCDPFHVTRVGHGPSVVAPSRRFAYDRPVDLVEHRLIKGLGVFGGKRAIIEEVFVDAIGKHEAILRVAGGQFLMEPCGRIGVVLAGDIGIEAFQTVLGVPTVVAPPSQRVAAVPRSIPVLGAPVVIANVGW